MYVVGCLLHLLRFHDWTQEAWPCSNCLYPLGHVTGLCLNILLLLCLYNYLLHLSLSLIYQEWEYACALCPPLDQEQPLRVSSLLPLCGIWDLGIWTQVVRFGGRCLSPLSHLASSYLNVIKARETYQLRLPTSNFVLKYLQMKFCLFGCFLTPEMFEIDYEC